MNFGYLDKETGNDAPAIIKEISERGDELLISFVDGSYNIQDNNEVNEKNALELMEKQAKERNESGLSETVNKKYKLYHNFRPVIAAATTTASAVPLLNGTIQEQPLLGLIPIALATIGIINEAYFRKEKNKKLELDKYACFLEIKDLYEELYNSNESHMIENLHAGTNVKGFLTINDLDDYSVSDIFQIAKNIQNISALSGIFVDTPSKVKAIKK